MKQNTNAQGKEKSHRLLVMTTISIVGLVFVLAHLAWPTLAIDTITVVLLVIVAIPWLSEFISSATFPGGWELKFVQRRLKEQAEQIDTLQFLVTHLLTEDQINYLQQLSQNTRFLIKKNRSSPVLSDDLRHLRGLGFITNLSDDKTVAALISELNNKGEVALLDSFCITPIGKRYLDLREQFMTESAVPNKDI